MPLNNEQVGICAELAIADTFNVQVNPNYRLRGVPTIANSIRPIIPNIFSSHHIPTPITHIAERQNPIDFLLTEGQTLSVKTNKQSLGKAAPQKIGQTSSSTWFNYLATPLGLTHIPNTYQEKSLLFKQIALNRTCQLLTLYWQNMFDCDYLIHIYNVVDRNDYPTFTPQYVVFTKTSSPIWDPTKITFTKNTVESWNESTTLKYCGISIGEFQVHEHRDNFKFRFNMAGIITLLHNHQLNFSSSTPQA